jgi:capsular exopolysaccharide synthesis family protein
MTNITKTADRYAKNYGTESRESLDFNLENYLIKLKRRWKPALAVFLLTIGTTLALSTLLQRTYQSEAKILFKQNPIDNLTGLKEGEKKFRSILDNQTPLKTELERITSDPVLEETIDRLKLTDDKGQPLKPKTLEQQLSVKIVGGSDVVALSYKDADPYTSSKVINTLMDVYIQNQIKSNQNETASADIFIDNQIPKIATKLKTLESNLQGFYEKNQVVDLQEEKRTIVADLSTINRQISTVGAELQGTKAQTGSLQSQLGLTLNQAMAANQLGSSPTVQGILSQLAETETQIAQESQRFNDNHPTIQSLQEKKAYLNSGLQQLVRQYVGTNVSDGLLQGGGLKENQLEKYINLKIDELSLQRQLSALYQYQNSYVARAKELPRLEKTEQEILRDVESARKTYETLLGNQQELELLVNQQTGNAEVIELARVPEEGSTGRMALMALGIIAGLFLSNITVVLLEMQDRTLKSIPELKQKFAYSVLGIIPLDSLAEQSNIVVQREPDSFASELYRMIQANLKFLTSQRQPKVILVTSSVPNEGKSTVAANLAAAMAQLGRKVLIIDGDLRKASQHSLWQVQNKMGIRDVIVHKASLSASVIKPMKQLDLLTSGPIGPNPLALIDSPEMSELVASARRDYDLVIIDAPPLPVTADVLTLSKLADGILFVSRPGVVEHESAELAQETLANVGQKVLGMVINGVKPSEFDRYSYHAKYSKNYFSRPQTETESNTQSKTVTA